MKINFAELGKTLPTDAVLVFLVTDDKKLSPLAQALDKQAGGTLTRAVEASRFMGKRGQLLPVVLPASVKTEQAVLLGVGKAKDLTPTGLENLGGAVMARLQLGQFASATLVYEGIKDSKVKAADAAARLAHGAHLRSYRFDKYFTKTPVDEKPKLRTFTLAAAGSKAAAGAYAPLGKLAEGVFFTRDLVSEPANVIYPASLAKKCEELKSLGVGVKVLGVAEMKKLGMGALLGVGQGSVKESKMVIMTWNGASKDGKNPLAFVGKGVTFDTGGISIKPSGGMEEMKWDMGGAGVVIGLMRALAGRKAKVNVVGAVGLVENMPDGNAQRPGDVVTSMSGQTIEVLNTDAEGRLVLADVLWYAQKNYKPKLVIDLATLTGAIIVALGTSRAGLFSNNDQLADRLFKTGEKTGEDVWRLPLGDVYDKQINSDIADMQNIGREREAGSITAAQFLQRFIEKDTPWAHLDIAGVAWSKKPSDLAAKGATAYGVRLLNQFVADFYEGKKMTTVQFYHLTATPLERALPRLVEKAYGAGHRILLVDSTERLESLNQLLWTFSTLTFLPHGGPNDASPEQQPILLAPTVDNKNGADVLLVTDGSSVPENSGFERIIDMFDGNDKEAVEKARSRWKTYQNAGHTLTYLRQTEQGGWEEKQVA